MKKGYLVELHGDAREVYHVLADSAAGAEENWATYGALILYETSSMDVYSVREDE